MSSQELDVNCPGCGVALTIINAGGYRCFCERCVNAMPQLPVGGGSYLMEGVYPNFKWVNHELEHKGLSDGRIK